MAALSNAAVYDWTAVARTAESVYSIAVSLRAPWHRTPLLASRHAL